MTDMLAVDIAALRQLGNTLNSVAGAITALDCRSGFSGVCSGLPSAEAAGVASGAGERVAMAFAAVADRVRHLAAASTNGAATYEAAEAAFTAQLQAIGGR